MELASTIASGEVQAARRLVAALPRGPERELGAFYVSLWFEDETRVRSASLRLRSLASSTEDRGRAAACQLAVAHAMAVTDPEGGASIAARAAAWCADALPEAGAEAAALAALLGPPAPPGAPPSDALHGDLLHAAARVAHAGPDEVADALAEVIDRLDGLPEACRRHATRWCALAEHAAGLTRITALAGRPVVLDTVRATVSCAGALSVSLAGSRRRFDLIAHAACRPAVPREELFERVWGHRWQGASSRNALQATVSRTRAVLPDGVTLEVDDHGRYRIGDGATVYVRGPVPASTEAASEAGALVGRADELARIRDALAPEAWVALWGPPGVGKSRLAREVSRTWGGRVVRAELRGVRSRGGVIAQVARRLGCELDAVGEALRARPDTLLVLDDLDDLDDVPLEDLLHTWRRDGTLRILTTHRRQRPADLGLPVPPLTRDNAAALLAAGEPPTPGHHALAQRLDGLPLVLELLGRHLDVVSPEDLLEVLPALLAQQADPVATAIEVSLDALTSDLRSALARLSVVDVALPRSAALAMVSVEQLAALIGRALVQDAGPVVELLRAVRGRSAGHLDARGRRSAVGALLQWATALPPEDWGPALPTLEALLREASESFPAEGARLAAQLLPRLRGLLAASVVLELAEVAVQSAPDALRAHLGVVHADALQAAGLDHQARALLDRLEPELSHEALALARLVRARIATSVPPAAIQLTLPPEVAETTEAAVADASEATLPQALTVRGLARLEARDFDGARQDLTRALSLVEAQGTVARATATSALARVDLQQGRYAAATELLAGVVRDLGELGLGGARRLALQQLHWGLQRIGRFDDAERCGLESLELCRSVGDLRRAALALQGLASVAFDRGDLDLALRRAYDAQATGRGEERVARAVRASRDLAAAVHLELGQLDEARALVAGDPLQLTSQGVIVLLLLAARDGRTDAVEDIFAGGKTYSPGVLALWGTLRHILGEPGAEELVRRGVATLPEDEVLSRRVVEAAQHRVLGAPLVDPTPQSYLARLILRWPH